MQRLRRSRVALLALALTVGLPAGRAVADAAGPTDYRTTIVEVQPENDAIHPSIIGGDSFLRLIVDPGTRVDVYGYRSEPFIRFLPDGTVEENRASASWYASRSRSGSDLPDGFDEDAEPDWHVVATDGDFTWHDHRTHWMTSSRPPGKSPGDVILRQSVLLVVDGVATEIVVESVWLAEPSSVPMWAGIVVGIGVGVLAGARRRFITALPLVDLAGLSLAVGIWQFASLPASTGPRPLWWAVPAVAFVAATAVAALRRRPPGLVEHAAMLLAGVNLLVWSWERRDGFDAALLATDAPGWLDRCVSAAALGAGVAVTLVGLGALVRVIVSPPEPATSPAT